MADGEQSKAVGWGCFASFATLCALTFGSMQMPVIQRHPPLPAWLPLIPISVVIAGVAGAVSPRRPFAAGLLALLAPSAVGLLAIFVVSCGMAEWWQLLVVLGTLLASGTLPGTLLLALVLVTCARRGERAARWVALAPTVLIVTAVGAWSIADYVQQARLRPIRADAERLVRDIEPLNPKVTWDEKAPQPYSSPAPRQTRTLSGSTSRGWVSIAGLPEGSGPAGLGGLTLTERPGPSLTLSYSNLAPAVGNAWRYEKDKTPPPPSPDQTPAVLAQHRLLRDDIARRFVPVQDASCKATRYEAHLHGLTLWYTYRPPTTYESASEKIAFLGRYDPAQP